MLRIANIHKRFGMVNALGGVSLDLEPGEFVSFLGPSGCGKTTLLRIIAGLEVPDSGEISLGDTRFVGQGAFLSPQERNLGMMFQSYALWPHMTIFDNIAYPLRVRKETKAAIEEKVSAMLSSLGLEALAGRRPDELSGGQQQRVALGRALVTRPRALLLDEPLSNVDARVRHEMRVVIRRIQQASGVTAIYVTHDQEEALGLSDRIVVMNHGHIEQVGTPKDIYSRPATAFVAEFAGSNIIQGTVLRAHAGRIVIRAPSLGREIETPGVAASGTPVTLSVHKEDVRLVAHDKEGASPAKVVVASYFGDRVEGEVRLEDGSILRGRFASAATIPSPGSDIAVEIDPQSFWLVDGAGRVESRFDMGHHSSTDLAEISS